MATILNSNSGYPRIGENREWKKLLESFWAGKVEAQAFEQQMQQLRLNNLRVQQNHGIGLIPVGDFSYYDHILDHSAMFGLVPSRFKHDGGAVPLNVYFAMARGNAEATACEMTKWFNTNYHYIVPEIADDAVFTLAHNRPLEAYREAKRELGIEGKPVIVGPYTFLKLSKGYSPASFTALLDRIVPVYAQLLTELRQEGVEWVQIDEPSLVTSTVTSSDIELVSTVYARLKNAAPELRILLQTYFDSVEFYSAVSNLQVDAIGLDFVHGLEGNLEALRAHGLPAGKLLFAGIVDGRNIWRSDLSSKLKLARELAALVGIDRIVVQPSCSLLHSPVSVRGESKLDPVLLGALAFAEEKLDEIAALGAALYGGDASVAAAVQRSADAVAKLAASPARSARGTDAKAAEAASVRPTAFAERQQLQQAKWQLPALPTTTIGSFPQTAEVRGARLKWRKGELDKQAYETFIKEQIRKWIDIQEEIGLDVLVHGEFERTDMVEFFGEKLGGFAFTQNGWVQSYGSRCVKPPVIYGDVTFLEPMTVDETVYAQSLTSKPVKGMLTGPITVLNWSFVRDDISRKQVAYQIALALREEVEALERAGIEMIQVDEPALREGLPLKRRDWDAYLDWSVKAFRISTSTVKDTTQIHTHMCYCEFHDIIDAISALDADVISIETSRSHGELIESFESNTYDKGIGLGVYDIHSPRVPHQDEMSSMVKRALRVLPAERFWINPDCGLKTRGIDETIASLKAMVCCAHEMRAQL